VLDGVQLVQMELEMGIYEALWTVMKNKILDTHDPVDTQVFLVTGE